ncbi:uncharacterized protein LOC113870467 [Abrus precatorius]|uniref:Uncharacterized protein LOC113870467 n=1 Tax=Abrus precatorius TaxID=3816 RepID=A0A8B8M556_ABRPR|nr:uncharacterized protein LOC113870467 [Abrus precatorius]
MAAAKSSAASGVVHEPLTKENYHNWSALVRNYLLGAGLWSVVNLCPENGGKIKREIWKKKDAKALHIIQLACGSEVLSHIRDVHTAKEAWNTLSVLYGSKLKADLIDVENAYADRFVVYTAGEGGCTLHKYVEYDMWHEAKSLLNRNKNTMLIFSTSASERTALHVAVIAGHERIVNNLVNRGKKKLAEMRDKDGYTALALAAELTRNTEIARIMVEMKGGGGEKLLTMMTRKDEIPVLLAASKGHKKMTRYLFRKTPLHALLPLNANQARLDVGPLYALADMPSVFPSGCEYGLVKRLVYKFLILETIEVEPQDLNGKTIRIVLSAAHDTSFLGRILIWVQLLFQNYILRHIPGT